MPILIWNQVLIIINEYQNKSEFESYKRKYSGSSFKIMYSFIDQNICHITPDEMKTLETIDQTVREIRNEITHNIQEINESYVLQNIIKDNINVDKSIYNDYRIIKLAINKLFEILERFKEITLRIVLSMK
ncbi:hypothetical protein BK120_32475 [Paenibacillus sp. FSL A5-0031]|uniref:hypothetical protein n=1 Tax=Paenibacillus sp. FSL A5-0031 TaxID=1920420 RepID=UPI00096FBDE2|nr:hypothetical protein [Paenibacillus sp. FSL A5-0031]OME73995.1 hypothetical protein BK120_32475 [Paenibacillus sp. FSL A5-0031]